MIIFRLVANDYAKISTFGGARSDLIKWEPCDPPEMGFGHEDGNPFVMAEPRVWYDYVKNARGNTDLYAERPGLKWSFGTMTSGLFPPTRFGENAVSMCPTNLITKPQ